jgi:hypothetical protein
MDLKRMKSFRSYLSDLFDRPWKRIDTTEVVTFNGQLIKNYIYDDPFLREAVLKRTPLVKHGTPVKIKPDPLTVQRLRKEADPSGNVEYTGVGHNNPMPWLLKNWGLSATDTSRELLPLLWWVNRTGQVVIWEIPKGQSATNVVHDTIPEYRKDASPRFHGRTPYQGRIDRFRKTVTVSIAPTDSLLGDRALLRGKSRVETTLARMFKGYTILSPKPDGYLNLET